MFLKYCYIVFIFVFPIYSEKIITAKPELPDSYFGLKVGAVLSPSFGFRYRDQSSGISNARKDDRTGFSMPWTLLMISKEWEEKKVTVEFWAELTRASNFSSDTTFDNSNSNKTNPYTFLIRRANVQKKWGDEKMNFKIVFGIQDLPHLHTQWNGNWKWRYVSRAPLEFLGFAPQPADLGLSGQFQYQFLQVQVGVMNGEGYRDTQNTRSSAFDVFGRISLEKEFGKSKPGIHFIGRAGNAFGEAGNECREAVGSCVPSDNNMNTILKKDLRSLQSRTGAIELTFQYAENINIGLGALARRQYSGVTKDILNPYAYPVYDRDSIGRAVYGWFGIGAAGFWLVYRGEQGTGSSGVLGTTHKYIDPLQSTLLRTYSSKTYFKRNEIFAEYNFTDFFRMSIGFASILNFDFDGRPEKVYIDQIGNQRSSSEYLGQISTPSGIVEYKTIDKIYYIKSTIDF
ncbi:MAG: hypothetical protein SFU98_20665 [Leptospiraceae bacterium]|nr:hypothetical protein [Leptospiraceae bacterium]